MVKTFWLGILVYYMTYISTKVSVTDQMKEKQNKIIRLPKENRIL